MAAGFVRRACAMPGVVAVEADSVHSFARHTHDQYGVGVLLRGAQASLSGRGGIEAQAGDVITVNPGEVHDGRPLDARGRAWCMLYIDPPLLAETLRDMREGEHGSFEFTQPVLRDPRAAACVRGLFEAMTAEGGLRAEQSLLAALACLGAFAEIRPGPSAAIARACERIDDDPAAVQTLQDLAGAAGLSRFQLVRSFVRVTGLTPHAYLLQRRLQLARRLIGTGLPLAEVAAASGFADQSHLTRLFARSFGLPPGAYARAQ